MGLNKLMLSDDLITAVTRRFDGPRVRALVLMGSHAQGTAGPYSDVDVVRLLADESTPPEVDGSYLLENRLVVVSSVTPEQVDRWFSEPDVAVEVIAGVRQAQALRDDGTFTAIQSRANAFRWDEAMQSKANKWAGDRLVGWIEEVHKGLEGLRRDETGRLLNARFGLSWGLSRVVAVQRGVLLSGDNALYEKVGTAMADQPEWLRLRRLAFGIEDESGHAPTLREQVTVGLRLYVHTAILLNDVLQPERATLIRETVNLINRTLSGSSYHHEDLT